MTSTVPVTTWKLCGLKETNKYSALQKFLNKITWFLTISKHVLILNALYKQYESKIRPNETLSLIFSPYCLISSISFCWKLVVLRGITWIMWLQYINFVNFTNCPRNVEGTVWYAHCKNVVSNRNVSERQALGTLHNRIVCDKDTLSLTCRNTFFFPLANVSVIYKI